MRGRICLFAKTPKLGEVKTRLEADIGQQGSLSLHKWLVQDRLQLISRELDADFQIHVTDSIDDEYWRSCLKKFKNVSVHRQIGESLGGRMGHVSSKTGGCSWTILIGADCPDLDHHYLNQAINLLNSQKDVVIGPALDGGYVLLGFRAHIPELFQSIDWGTDQVLAQTLSVLNDYRSENRKLECSQLEPLRDLDLIDDLRYYSKKHVELEKLFFANSSTLL